MCSVCGCGSGETKFEKSAPSKDNAHCHDHPHTHADGTTHSHAHEHEHSGGSHHHHQDDHHEDGHHHHHHDHDHGDGIINYGAGPARAHAPGMSQARMVAIEQDILAKNNAFAAANRDYFSAHGVLALNLVSSPGSGKTTLLVKTMERLKEELPIAVIEGDQQTSNDAERIRATGVPAIQVNTGKGCHLDGHMVGHAVEHLAPADGTVLFIENVGNLVCPAAFDLGEAHKVVILSVTEGEDKPLKYPDMFHAADLMIVAKIDLLPHLDFDVGATIANARRINPRIKVLQVSAKTGEGLDAWMQWIRAARWLALTGRTDISFAQPVQGA
ncbi:hydrogenase accessory protein HypB [Hyphomicrobium denitrificans 1NES1]|uniref:Hydrogenase maturation factor HypB n=1 Tax=Hyphomicrobium denitrificans 1NES1 TaxID=670307 RepID=N0B557_9HYPH|nr:hydrogenase nickel incorporation protein HypB [Hyphomicrobium denitrificans]AGK57347.1 hydrogenase accessory protein HypB [Hyphomicrobium denitrificans 1NES1]